MPVRRVEVPELSRPAAQRAGGQHPVFTLDDLPDLARQPRQRDGRGVPVLARILLPARPDRVVAAADRGAPLVDAAAGGGIGVETGAAEAGELGDAEGGVAEGADRAGLHAAVIERPFADADLGEADLHPVAILRNDGGDLARG